MGVAKWQGREKPAKTEQRRVWGPEWGPQAAQTAPLAGPVYIGQARGRKRHIKRGAKGPGSLSPTCVSRSLSLSSRLLGQHALTPRGCIFLYFLNKTDLSENYSMDCPRAVMQRALMSVTSNLCCDKTE